MISEPVYVVSGYMRSGTSMMMKALEQGGMNICYSKEKDRILENRFAQGEYHPNPEGFFELGPREFESPNFPSEYQGRLIKALHWRLKLLPPYFYRVLFMLRDPLEIKVSYLKMFRQRPPFVLEKYQEFVDETLVLLARRGDMAVTTVWHHHMMENPRAVLENLKSEGFPITDCEQASKAVNPGLYRSKTTDLETVRQGIPGLRTDLPSFLKKQSS